GNLEERPVEPLSVAEFRLLLERRLEAGAVHALERLVNFHELFTRMLGNPLFLGCFLDDLADRWAKAARTGTPLTLDARQLPTSLEAVFQTIYNRIRQRQEGQPLPPEGRQKARLLQLLSVAREPLGLEELAGLMTVWGESIFLD